MRRGRCEQGPEMVTASEVASYVYCAEAWRLEHGLGLKPGNRAALQGRGAAPWPQGGVRAAGWPFYRLGAAARYPGPAGAAPVGADAMMIWLVILAVLLLGLVLVVVGQVVRQRRGLGQGRTVSLDRVALTSARLGLTGRPDRIIKADGTIIVEEWKSGRKVRDLRTGHRWAFTSCWSRRSCGFGRRTASSCWATARGTGSRIRRRCGNGCSSLAEAIRAARAVVAVPIPVSPTPGQCRPCGQRGNCGQARL